MHEHVLGIRILLIKNLERAKYKNGRNRIMFNELIEQIEKIGKQAGNFWTG